jgi:hypothetical protein
MLVPLTWRPLYLGTSSLTFAGGLELRLMHGGGYVPSVAVWRLERRVLVVVEAGSA